MDEWLSAVRTCAHHIQVHTDARTDEEYYSTASAVEIARQCLDQCPCGDIVRAQGLSIACVQPCAACASSHNPQTRQACLVAVALLISTLNTEAEQGHTPCCRRRRKRR